MLVLACDCFQAAVGQLKPAGPNKSLTGQPIFSLMGQCELIAQILWCMKRALPFLMMVASNVLNIDMMFSLQY